ncbi:MAG: DUF188 domain-containing protein [Thermoleophilia bacterium]|nr:DUF188 domain-containing protein [Thermoleophilia bacterium]
MTTLFIDADACPVTRDAIAIARSRSLPVVLVANQSQNLAGFRGRAGIEILQVASGRDSADFAMVPRLAPGDIVVTGDTGLAAMALGRGCRPLSPRGREYLPATIDAELAVRHAEQRHRRAGGRTIGPSPYRAEDRDRFREVLARLLSEGAGVDAEKKASPTA